LQRVQVQGLGEEVAELRRQLAAALGGEVLPGHEDQRHFGVTLPDRSRQLLGGAVGQVQVKQGEVEFGAVQMPQGTRHAGRGHDAIAHAGQHAVERAYHRDVVVHDQDGPRARHELAFTGAKEAIGGGEKALGVPPRTRRQEVRCKYRWSKRIGRRWRSASLHTAWSRRCYRRGAVQMMNSQSGGSEQILYRTG
jgi:hypothetical protein